MRNYIMLFEEFLATLNEENDADVLKDEKLTKVWKILDSSNNPVDIRKDIQEIIKKLDATILRFIQSDFKKDIYNEKSYKYAEGKFPDYIDAMKEHLDDKFGYDTIATMWEDEDEGPSCKSWIGFLVRSKYLSPDSYVKMTTSIGQILVKLMK